MPPASSSCSLRPASCTPLQTLRFLLYALGFQLSTHASSSLLLASCFRLPASCALCLYSLLSAPSALSHLLPASCALCLYSLLSTLYSLLLRSLLSAFRSLPFNRHPPKNGLPGSCIGGGQSRSSSTHQKKRVRSATSRRTPTLSVCYQLAFFTPGMRPFEAISRNWIRLMPN